MNNSKQEAIRKAWGENYDYVKKHIDDLGWCMWTTVPKIDFQKDLFDIRTIKGYKNNVNRSNWRGCEIRPKSIKGIEDNNGWIKIESKEDLPKESNEYWVCESDGYINIRFYLSALQQWGTFDAEVERPNVTHYQHIVKPKAPIH